MVDELMDDYINVLIDKYKNIIDLSKYKYIDNLIDFSLLPLKGSMKCINKYNNKLCHGGLVIKIYKSKKNERWYALILRPDNFKYRISFHANYIFYLKHKSRTEKIKDTLQLFMFNVENGKYIIK